MTRRYWLGALAVFVWLATAPLAGAQQWPVSEIRLDNGLQVIVREDHRAPVVVSQIWYRVGSSYEHSPTTGVSHVLEHMMFKGTETLAPGEFSRIIAREGGRENAFTGRDYTAYFQQLSADRLETAFRLEADRMHRLRLDADAFAKELQVVIEERRLRIEDRPLAAFGERFNTIAYPVSPYRQPIIGWPADLDNLRLDDLATWYERWYTPANATLVVVGDVDPQHVFDLAREHFGPVPGGEAPAPRHEPSLPAPGERRFEASDERADVPHVILGYQVPSAATAGDATDVYALEVLATVLDGGDGARLPQRLVRDREIAAGVSAGYSSTSRLETRFTLEGSPTRAASPNALEQALREEVAALHEEPVSEEALARARNQLLADHLFQLDSMFYQAMRIGRLETTGIGWEWLEGYEEGIRAVTSADIQRVARAYLTPERLTVGILRPGGRDGGDGGKSEEQ